jgi:uncharacterized LabA/DUF88 family protein
MPAEPPVKRCFAFVDGQNLFKAAEEAFGYSYPNYDPLALASSACAAHGWVLTATHFYTGVPDQIDDPFWHHFWTAKMAVLGTRGVSTYARALRYRNETIRLPDGSWTAALVRREKGIDIRIALDVVRHARTRAFDVALIFSQDQDLSEVADEVRRISIDQNRWMKTACAFPFSPTIQNTRGINGTFWIRLERLIYDACLDPNDYRRKKS